MLYRGRLLGRVSVAVPLNDRLLRALGGGLDRGDRLVAVRGAHVVAGADAARSALAPGHAGRVRFGATEYRGLADRAAAGPGSRSPR